MLKTLIEKAGELISRDELTQIALNRKLTLYDRAIDMHVSNVRRKIGAQSKLNETLVGRNTTIGKNCSLDNVVIDHGSNVPDNTILSDAQWPLIE